MELQWKFTSCFIVLVAVNLFSFVLVNCLCSCKASAFKFYLERNQKVKEAKPLAGMYVFVVKSVLYLDIWFGFPLSCEEGNIKLKRICVFCLFTFWAIGNSWTHFFLLNLPSIDWSLVVAGSDDLYTELWKACAGPLVDVPCNGERVYYFPQGHMEQVSFHNP